MPYDFPVTDPYDALTVTEPQFSILEHMDVLYADINEYRVDSDEFWANLEMTLHLEGSELVRIPDNYVRVMLSGHRGCGKSLELKRFHDRINNPNGYYSIRIDLEQELDMVQFEPEHLFMLIAAKLADEVYMRNLPINRRPLDELARDWFSDEEIKKEIISASSAEGAIETGVDVSWFLKFKTSLKLLTSYESKTVKSIKEKVFKDPFSLIDKLNLVLQDIREKLPDLTLGKDILFIIDSSERIEYDKYEKLFIGKHNQLSRFNMNVIYTVPIDSFYELDKSTTQNLYTSVILPMVDLRKPDSLSHFRTIVTKRIDQNTFFEENVLDYLVDMSGGCPRQLLQLVNRAIVLARKEKINKVKAEKVVYNLGVNIRNRISAPRIEKIKDSIASNTFDLADNDIRLMLKELVLLKYNGKTRLNPILEDLID